MLWQFLGTVNFKGEDHRTLKVADSLHRKIKTMASAAGMKLQEFTDEFLQEAIRIAENGKRKAR